MELFEITKATLEQENSRQGKGFSKEKSLIHMEGYGNIPGFLSVFQFRIEFIKQPSEWHPEKKKLSTSLVAFTLKEPDFSLRKQNSGIRRAKKIEFG